MDWDKSLAEVINYIATENCRIHRQKNTSDDAIWVIVDKDLRPIVTGSSCMDVLITLLALEELEETAQAEAVMT